MTPPTVQKVIAVTALVLTVYANGVAAGKPVANVNVINDNQVVGLSEGTTQGNAGIVRMYELCQDTFGPHARMCTTEEVIRSPSIVGLLEIGDEAWVQPVIAALVKSEDSFQVRDVTGINVTFEAPTGRIPKNGLSCTQWTQSAGWGGTALLRESDGRTLLDKQICSANIHVLCCAPHLDKGKKKKRHKHYDD